MKMKLFNVKKSNLFKCVRMYIFFCNFEAFTYSLDSNIKINLRFHQIISIKMACCTHFDNIALDIVVHGCWI